MANRKEALPSSTRKRKHTIEEEPESATLVENPLGVSRPQPAVRLKTPKLYECGECDKAFSSNSSLWKHKIIHTGEKYICKYCKRTFPDSSSMVEHRRTHTGETPYECKNCGRAFLCNDSLLQHIEEPCLSFLCGVCSKPFESLKSHRKSCPEASRFSCNICGHELAKLQDLVMHKRTHTREKPITCEICYKEFQYEYVLQNHRTVHTGERLHKCDVCEKMFASSSSLSKHKLLHVPQEQRLRFECDICHRTFARSDILLAHKKTVHATGKTVCKHKCKLCKRGFSTIALLKSHKEYHTGQREIDVVPHKEFNDQLGYEMKAKEPTEMTYLCFECGKEFNLIDELVKHNQVHNIKSEPK